MLRVLKPEIEHIKKVYSYLIVQFKSWGLTFLLIRYQILEKCRNTMQQQFDQWYSNLHSREIQVVQEKTDSSHGKDSFDRRTVCLQGTARSSTGEYRRASNEERDMKYSASSVAIVKTSVEKDDTDVNEDIMAFYQAKEELLKRRGAR